MRPSRLAAADGTDSSQLRPSEASERTDQQQLSLSRPVRASSVVRWGRSLQDFGKPLLTHSLICKKDSERKEGRVVRLSLAFLFFALNPNLLFTELLENRFLLSLSGSLLSRVYFLFVSGEVPNGVLWSEDERKQKLFAECQLFFFSRRSDLVWTLFCSLAQGKLDVLWLMLIVHWCVCVASFSVLCVLMGPCIHVTLLSFYKYRYE